MMSEKEFFNPSIYVEAPPVDEQPRKRRGKIWLLVPRQFASVAVAVTAVGTLALVTVRPVASQQHAMWKTGIDTNKSESRLSRMTAEMTRRAGIANRLFVRTADGGADDDDPDYGL